MRLGRSEAGGRMRDTANDTRRRLLLRILACAFTTAGAIAAPAAAQKSGPHRFNLPLARDLAADGAASGRARIPVFLFFDRYDCTYCDRALAQFVVPMSKEAPWRDRALYRQVEIDQPLPLVGFDGSASTHELLAASHRVSLTPTVIVVDGRGNVIGKPVVGLLTDDFYAAYLEAAINAGVAGLRGATG